MIKIADRTFFVAFSVNLVILFDLRELFVGGSLQFIRLIELFNLPIVRLIPGILCTQNIAKPREMKKCSRLGKLDLTGS